MADTFITPSKQAPSPHIKSDCPIKKRFQMIFFFGKRLKKILIPGKGSAVSCSLMKIYPQSKNISEFPSFTSLSKFWGNVLNWKFQVFKKHWLQLLSWAMSIIPRSGMFPPLFSRLTDSSCKLEREISVTHMVHNNVLQHSNMIGPNL